MPFGALAPLPFRLGGSDTTGITAAQHARYCADLVACRRVRAMAEWTFTVATGPAVTISGYRGWQGAGSAHAPDTVTVNGATDFSFQWTNIAPEDDYEQKIPAVFKSATADRHAATVGNETVELIARGVRIRGVAVGESCTVSLWGSLGRETEIGDYGGGPDKRDSDTEGRAPYAAAILRDLQQHRGSAYSKLTGKYVDVENLALARFLAAVFYRTPEKFRANLFPARATERLEYHRKVLGVPKKLEEPAWRTRQKCAAHYQSTEGPTLEALTLGLTDLLGSDVFVSVTWDDDTALETPGGSTYWPGVNPNVSDYDLGPGTWSTLRNHLFVEVTQPPRLTEGEFLTLLQVDLFHYLDMSLPAWATFAWGVTEAGGFLLDISRLDFTPLTTP